MKLLLLACLTLVAVGTISLRAEDFPGLKEPLKTVTVQYIVIEQKLAADSFAGVTAAAMEMKAAIDAAPPKSFADDFTKATDELAAAKDLHAARVAFQDVGNGLIAALAQAQVQTGALHSVFCPMRKAYWLQTDGRVVHNPYFGAAMPDCGEIQRQF